MILLHRFSSGLMHDYWLWMVQVSVPQCQAWEPGSTPVGAFGFFPAAAQGDVREGTHTWSAAKSLF